jgi:hypothetical protein
MAGRGLPPKDASQRRRRNSVPRPTVVTADGKIYGPELPETYEWPAATLKWWQVWRTCPQASRFTDTDWSFLVDTAVLHAEFWLGDRSVAAELRLRAAKFGATPEDRARLKFEVGDPGAVVAPTRLRTKSARDRRARLLRAAAEAEAADADDDGEDGPAWDDNAI